jgi:hypothetical protein
MQSEPREAHQLPRGPARQWLPGILAALVSLAVLSPLVNRTLHYDEFIHLFNLVNYGVVELLATPHGGHLLYLSNLVYLMGFGLFGIDPTPYYVVALITHGLNVFLFQRVLDWMTDRPFLSGVAAALWGCSPVNEGAVGWFAVYGQLLVTFFLLWILLDAARAVRAKVAVAGWIQLRWALLLLAAAGSFGFGLAVAAGFFAAIGLLLPGVPRRRSVVRHFSSMVIALPLVYAGVHALQNHLSDRPPLFGLRHAAEGGTLPTLTELASGISLLWSYFSYGLSSVLLGPLLFSDPTGVVIGPLRGMPPMEAAMLCHGVAVSWLLLFGLALRRADCEARSRALGLVLLAIACYGVVAFWKAASGAALQMSIFVPQMQMLARYHYLPPLLLLTASVCLLPRIPRVRARRIAAAAGLLVVVVSALFAHQAVRKEPQRWSAERIVQRMDGEIRAQPVGGIVFLENRPLPISFPIKHELLPGRAALFVIVFPENTVHGRSVHFVEQDLELLSRLRQQPDTRIARLLLSPAEAAARGWSGSQPSLWPKHGTR